MVFNCFSGVFLQVFQTYISSVSSVLFCMFQVLHLDVSKVDRVLHMLLWLYIHVSSACFKYFICLKHMLQVFHLEVSKVDLREVHVVAASASSWVTVLPWVTAGICWWWWCCCMHAGV
jgi:hypothetical protein